MLFTAPFSKCGSLVLPSLLRIYLNISQHQVPFSWKAPDTPEIRHRRMNVRQFSLQCDRSYNALHISLSTPIAHLSQVSRIEGLKASHQRHGVYVHSLY